MNIVVLDGYTVNPGDLSWDHISALGNLTLYDRTPTCLLVERSVSAHILVVNKVRVTAEQIAQLPELKCICLLATGYDNIDLDSAKERGIKVFNAVGYGTESVAQHTLALMLASTNRVKDHHTSVRQGVWSSQDNFSYSLHTMYELKGKHLGIIGYGKIGRRVAEMASVFGMQIMTTSKAEVRLPVLKVDFEELCRSCHFISLHAPLTTENTEIICKKSLALMRADCTIINTGRGGLINEDDLAWAISTGKIAGAALDVLSIEPPPASNRLIQLPGVLITPHMAWRSIEARNALIAIVAKNIQNFSNGRFEGSLV
jgi:glycerate dehydrogenase